MALRRANKGAIAVAMMLAFLAGSVDAIGFSRLGGLFVSFMSGNSTRLAVFLADGNRGRAFEVSAIIAAFVIGAGLGSAIGRTLAARRQAVVLTLEAALLAGAALSGQHGGEVSSALLMACGMGLENAVFLTPQGETSINLTFMTGALVKVGEGLATAAFGGPRWGSLPFLLLWASLVLGAFTGARCYANFGMATLYVVSGTMLLLGLGSRVWRQPDTTETDAPVPGIR